MAGFDADRGVGRWLLNIVAPVSCVACGDHGAHVCPACAQALRAASALRRRAWAGGPTVWALGAYDRSLRQAVLNLKFRGRRPAARVLGVILGRKLPLGGDALVPVPIDAHRLKQRGYNQTDAIAAGIAAALGKPTLDGALCRKRDRPAQSSLRLPERRRNAVAAFAAGSNVGAVSGKQIWLVDDVVTSGATAAACTAVLQRNGALCVRVAALAIKA